MYLIDSIFAEIGAFVNYFLLMERAISSFQRSREGEQQIRAQREVYLIFSLLLSFFLALNPGPDSRFPLSNAAV